MYGFRLDSDGNRSETMMVIPGGWTYLDGDRTDFVRVHLDSTSEIWQVAVGSDHGLGCIV